MLNYLHRERIDNILVYYPIKLGRNFITDLRDKQVLGQSRGPFFIKITDAQHSAPFFFLTIFFWTPFLLLLMSIVISKGDGGSSLKDWLHHLYSLGIPRYYKNVIWFQINLLLFVVTCLTIMSALVNTCHWINIKFSSCWFFFTTKEIFKVYVHKFDNLDFWRPDFTIEPLLKEDIESIEVNQDQYNDYFFFLLRWMDFWPKMTTWEMVIKLKTPVISPPNDLPLTEDYYLTRISIGNISNASLEFFLKLMRQELPNIEIQLRDGQTRVR